MKREKYEIWDAHVKFEDDPDTVATHPVLIWNDTVTVCIAYKITSTDRGDNNEEYRIKYWEEAGLDHESSIRLRKIVKLVDSDFIRKRGKLDDRDILRFEMRRALG